jgi:hypothetical protein
MFANLASQKNQEFIERRILKNAKKLAKSTGKKIQMPAKRPIQRGKKKKKPEVGL